MGTFKHFCISKPCYIALFLCPGQKSVGLIVCVGLKTVGLIASKLYEVISDKFH